MRSSATSSPSSPANPATTDALLPAALALVPDEASATTLESRFRLSGASLADGVAAALLTRLLELGLVRIARAAGPAAEAIYVPTSLGLAALANAVGGAPTVRLEELERLRSDLLSTIAHELRTPLTALRTAVGLLADPAAEPSTAQRATLVATIERNADRMQRLIGDVLDLTRFRAGSIRLQLRRFDACELATATSASIAPLAERRGVRIAVEGCGDPGAGPSVFGDRRRLEQALVNLLSNAVRFSPDGERVRVAVEARDDLVAWRVADRGPGIPSEDQARLFERFFVGGDGGGAAGAARDGIGLGLPTALAIAQAHGGAIEVESEVGRGSVFGLVVPADGPDEVE